MLMQKIRHVVWVTDFYLNPAGDASAALRKGSCRTGVGYPILPVI
jgi:hypothetical protein